MLLAQRVPHVATASGIRCGGRRSRRCTPRPPPNGPPAVIGALALSSRRGARLLIELRLRGVEVLGPLALEQPAANPTGSPRRSWMGKSTRPWNQSRKRPFLPLAASPASSMARSETRPPRSRTARPNRSPAPLAPSPPGARRCRRRTPFPGGKPWLFPRRLHRAAAGDRNPPPRSSPRPGGRDRSAAASRRGRAQGDPCLGCGSPQRRR